MRFILRTSLFLILTLAACKKQETIEPAVSTPPNATTIKSSAAIIVIDENSNPVNGAQVSFGSITKTTNSDGILLLRDIQMNKERAYIKINHTGYFLGSRVFKPKATGVENVVIKLLPKTNAGSFSSSAGGTVTSPNGVKLAFPANAIKYEAGGIYTGTVNVAIKHIDPTATDLFEIMPGNLSGKDILGSVSFLKTYGMAAIELTGIGGVKLNLDNGKKATLTMPVPSAIASSAPSTIPLWYFDEIEGIWKEEGSALFNSGNNEYVGYVSHFSFWNCDISINTTTISGRILCNGLPFQNAFIVLSYASNSINAVGGYTNSQGIYSGLVPEGEVLTMKIYDRSSCIITPIYTNTIGPFSSVTSIPDVIACAPTNNGVLNVSLKDCSGNPVTNGVLKVTNGGANYFYHPDASGNINTIINYCSFTSITISGFDFSNESNSDVQTITTSPSMNYGNLSTCVNYPDFLNYTFNGVYYSFDGITDTLKAGVIGSQTGIIGQDPIGWTTYMKVNDTTLGTHQVVDSVYVNSLNESYTNSNISIPVNFTSYDAVGGKISGTFSGTFIDDNDGITKTITNGNFRITRVN